MTFSVNFTFNDQANDSDIDVDFLFASRRRP
jgi:hypothetical protein